MRGLLGVWGRRFRAGGTRRWLGLALRTLFLLSFGSHALTAELSGSLTTQVALAPRNNLRERSLLDFEWENVLTLDLTLDGLSWSLESHAGLTGLEDLLLSFGATLGDLDLMGTLVFAQPFQLELTGAGEVRPACLPSAPGSGRCETLFVKKRVEVRGALFGILLSNLALAEDVNFPEPAGLKAEGATYGRGSQDVRLGDVLTLWGQTSGGVTVTVRTGVCAQKESFQVKNHTWPFTVDPDCGAFEELKIRGVPLAEGLFADLAVLCKGVEACSLTSTFEHTGTLGLDGVRTSASGTFDRLSFSEGSVRLESDRLALNLTLDDRPEVSLITASAGFNLNPDGHPARLNLFASGVPGEGLTSLTANLSVDRPGARFSTFVFFTDDGGAVEFSQLTLTVTVAAGAVNLELKSSVAPTGLIGGGVGATIAF